MKNTIIKFLSLVLLFPCLSVNGMETELKDFRAEIHPEILNHLTIGTAEEVTNSSTNALITAIQKGNSNAVSFLLKAGANPNLPVDYPKLMPIDWAWRRLSAAVSKGNKPSQENLEIYKILIKAGAKSTSSYGATPTSDILRKEYGINLPPRLENLYKILTFDKN